MCVWGVCGGDGDESGSFSEERDGAGGEREAIASGGAFRGVVKRFVKGGICYMDREGGEGEVWRYSRG